MSCEKCEHIQHSHDSKPFAPPSGSCNALVYACGCGTKWWQFNGHYHLWREIPDATYHKLKETGGHVTVDMETGAVVSDYPQFGDWHGDHDLDCEDDY